MYESSSKCISLVVHFSAGKILTGFHRNRSPAKILPLKIENRRFFYIGFWIHQNSILANFAFFAKSVKIQNWRKYWNFTNISKIITFSFFRQNSRKYRNLAKNAKFCKIWHFLENLDFPLIFDQSLGAPSLRPNRHDLPLSSVQWERSSWLMIRS